MSAFTEQVDNAVITLKEAGGKIDKVKIESDRLQDYYGDAIYIGKEPPEYEVVADPDVDAYEVMLEHEVRA